MKINWMLYHLIVNTKCLLLFVVCLFSYLSFLVYLISKGFAKMLRLK